MSSDPYPYCMELGLSSTCVILVLTVGSVTLAKGAQITLEIPSNKHTPGVLCFCLHKGGKPQTVLGTIHAKQL